jgi:hypothetical protein
MKKLIVPLLILAAIGGGIGFYLYNKPVASLQNKTPDVEVTAAQLVSEYENNEQTANEKYLGKLVQVSGTIAATLNEEGKQKLHLDSGNPMSLVICEAEEGKSWGDAAPGDEIKIKGLCSGYLTDVILVQCTPVK